ncbi:hypothetical protein HW555_001216 [Spodoptera exigua]|uniref:DUF7041 domain-containing protein n=1 Tax=Spodoptera exigua TaxID=7107 RepID=A0A835L931_SPOEX|nr:hypothetical protein HW555_001216 [Spodoptera exigua]
MRLLRSSVFVDAASFKEGAGFVSLLICIRNGKSLQVRRNMASEQFNDAHGVTTVQSDVATISLPARLPPFWRQNPRLWFAQFEAAVAASKIGEEQKFNLVVPLLGNNDLEQIADIILTQIRAVLSVNTESSLEMLAVMADKMMEHFEPASINAVSTATTCQENLQIALLSKQIEKLSLEIAELRTNQQNHRHSPRFPHRNRSRSHSRSRQHNNIKPGDPNWLRANNKTRYLQRLRANSKTVYLPQLRANKHRPIYLQLQVTTHGQCHSPHPATPTSPAPAVHPWFIPLPPDPGLRENLVTSMGYRRSTISTSVMRVFVMWVCTPPEPCQPGPWAEELPRFLRRQFHSTPSLPHPASDGAALFLVESDGEVYGSTVVHVLRRLKDCGTGENFSLPRPCDYPGDPIPHPSKPALFLIEASILDEERGLERGPLLRQADGVGRHGARREAADVCVVPAGRHCDRSFFAVVLFPYGVHHVLNTYGQNTGVMTVRSGRCEPPAFGWFARTRYLVLHSFLHGPQMHGYVGGVGHEPPVRTEQRAREVQPLLYVH